MATSLPAFASCGRLSFFEKKRRWAKLCRKEPLFLLAICFLPQNRSSVHLAVRELTGLRAMPLPRLGEKCCCLLMTMTFGSIITILCHFQKEMAINHGTSGCKSCIYTPATHVVSPIANHPQWRANNRWYKLSKLEVYVLGFTAVWDLEPPCPASCKRRSAGTMEQRGPFQCCMSRQEASTNSVIKVSF